MSNDAERTAWDAILAAGAKNAMAAGKDDLAADALAALSPEARDKIIEQGQSRDTRGGKK